MVNGAVGSTGISYSGNTAELSAIPAHPALRAVAPLYNDFDPQFFLTMPGGAYNRAFVEAWNTANQALDANDVCAIEEVDGIGCWWLKLAVPGVKPVDADSNGELMRDAVAGHATLELADALAAMSYRDDTLPNGVSIGDISPYSRLASIEAAGVPMLVRAGWLDAATADGALSRYLTSDFPQELVIGAWNHGGEDDVDPFQPRLTFPDPSFDEQFADLVAFFDRHMDEPPAPGTGQVDPVLHDERRALANDRDLAASRDGGAPLVPRCRPVADRLSAFGGRGGRLRGRYFRVERRHHPMAHQSHR